MNSVIVVNIFYISIFVLPGNRVGTGGVTISSSADIAPVCNGDELELTCTVLGRALEWNVSIPWMPPEFMTLKHTLTSVERISPDHTITINGSISFTFSRITLPDSQPLVSRLLISPAIGAVNGTVVICTDRETRNSSSTTVNVVHSNNDDSSTLSDSKHI